MKNVLLSLLLTLGVFTANAQLKISKTAKPEKITKVGVMGINRFELSRAINGTDTTYYVMYVNNAYKHSTKYESFHLTGSKEDMLQLEQLMLDVLNKVEEDIVTIELGGKEYRLYSNKLMGYNVLTFTHSMDYDYTQFAEKEIKKLFSSFHE